MKLGAFTRLGVANDDWGTPLSTTASLANAMYARDEGFYYRAAGAELAGTRDAPGRLGNATLHWRLFAERQRSAGVEPRTQASLLNAFGDAQFGTTNIDATRLDALGASAEIARNIRHQPRARCSSTRGCARRGRSRTAATRSATRATGAWCSTRCWLAASSR